MSIAKTEFSKFNKTLQFVCTDDDGYFQFVRAIVSYIESKLKKASGNDLVRCLICACKCCLWMLEKFMKFINRNAYIVCAIKSTNFCKSSKYI